MLGLFGALQMGARSLSVQQEASEVTGQNLANVNNTAYSRQQLVVTSATPVQTSAGQEGTGVQVVTISQVRSALLDSQIQQENSVTGSLNAQQTALQDAESELGEQISSATGSSAATSDTGLTSSLSSFFSALQSLSANPSDLTLRQTVIQSAQSLATQFQQVSSGLASVQAGLNSNITSDVATSNQDLSTIASLNKQIVLASVNGGSANDLVDLRQQKLEDLSSKVPVTTTMNSDGSMDITIGGVAMVTGPSQTDSLQTTADASGNLFLQATTAGNTFVNLSGGSIQGNIDARDGAVATLQSSVESLANQLITQVNTVYSSGYDLNGNTQDNFFEGTGASSITVSSSLAADPTEFQASGTAGASGDNTIVLKLAQLANQNIAGLNNQTFSQNYTTAVTSLGNSLSSVNDQVSNNAAVSSMLTTQRSSVSGVSTDEEMTNLIQYQKAYEASAELITTLNQMLETLITMKTV